MNILSVTLLSPPFGGLATITITVDILQQNDVSVIVLQNLGAIAAAVTVDDAASDSLLANIVGISTDITATCDVDASAASIVGCTVAATSLDAVDASASNLVSCNAANSIDTVVASLATGLITVGVDILQDDDVVSGQMVASGGSLVYRSSVFRSAVFSTSMFGNTR